MIQFHTFKAKLLWGAAAAFGASAFLAFIAVFGIRSGTQSLEAVYAYQVKSANALTEIDRDLKEIRFRMAAVALDQMPSVGSRNQLAEARANILAQWKIYKDLAKHTAIPSETKAVMDEVDKYLGKKFNTFLTKLDAAYMVGNKDLVVQALEEDWPAVHKALIKPVSAMVPAQWKAVATAYETSKAQGDQLMAFSLGVFGLVALVTALASYLLIRQINSGMGALQEALAGLADGNLTVKAEVRHRDEFAEMASHLDRAVRQLRQLVAGVKSASDRVAESSGDMSKQTAQVIQRVQVQYDNVMQVSSAMEEISVSISEVATAANQAAAAVHENSASATSGNENMRQNTQLVERTADSVNASAEIIQHLSESSAKIGEIATVINSIAEQTNLLALNAAIEAARAGEQGRGFAVVADEVRKLAEKTRVSTIEIGGVIEKIRAEAESAAAAMAGARSEVEASVLFNQKTGQALDKIVHDANRATDMMDHIVNGTREQSRATDSIAQNMERISAITEENTNSIRGFGQTAEDVSRVAGELRGLVAKLRV